MLVDTTHQHEEKGAEVQELSEKLYMHMPLKMHEH